MSDLDDIQNPHVAERVADDLYSSESEEIILKTTPVMSQDTITRSDLQDIIDRWEEKFNKLVEGVRAIEEGTHNVHAHVDMVMRENRVETCDPAHPTPVRTFVQQCAPKMSTPITPSGAPTRYRSEFSFTSPVNQTAPVEPTCGNGDRDLNHRPTHEDGNGNGSDSQQPTMNTSSRLNNTTTRYSSSPKVPIFDGTVSAQFRPWLRQFEAIARHQCWTSGEKVIRLVANMLIGMTMGQLDDYAFLVARLSRRYDPPEHEEAHRAELRARTRCRNETADEFAENLKNLAQRAYTNADQNMLDNLVVERFREGHNNTELKKHLCLYPSTGLQDLIGACVHFETHVELGTRSYKPNEGMYMVKGNESAGLSFDGLCTTPRRIEATAGRTTEVTEDLTDTRMGEILNKGVDSPRMGIRARTHRTQTDGRHLSERSNVGHVVSWDIMHHTVPRLVLSSLSRQKWSE